MRQIASSSCAVAGRICIASVWRPPCPLERVTGLRPGQRKRTVNAEEGMADIVATLLAPGTDLPPCDKRIAELYRYWLSIRPSPGLLPGRRNFHPADVPRLLQWIW